MNLDRGELPGGDHWRHEVIRHAAPTESRQKKIESTTEIDKSPKSSAGHPVICAVRVDRIRQDQLDIRSEIALCRRTS